MKTALITGVTGQDGAYLAELLLKMGYGMGDVVVKVDPRYYRPTQVETLLGDPSKAKAKLGWEPTTPFSELVRAMVEADYSAARRDSRVNLAGFQGYA